ncbi:hypothetical protein [Algoriphagus aquimarinus]|uniref:Uncharacterized protein n=1 Tax=Algoriphagus aquimarinus TaxID=237018 RepID=A0A5C7AFP9_9BACT|nr:hypothetical protein [Algoriphagus aquimarinus]TXE07570.1 hypothetical protein ESV85_15355 [Algoriphagus aquimarinus]
MKSKRNYLPSNLRINPKYHPAISLGAKVLKLIALVVFLIPFFMRIYKDATINSFFITFFSCLGISIFLMMVAEISEATIDKEIQI